MVALPKFRVLIRDPGPVHSLACSAGWSASQPLALVDANELCRHLQQMGAAAEVAVAGPQLQAEIEQAGNQFLFEKTSPQVTMALLAEHLAKDGPLAPGEAIAFFLTRPRRPLTGWRGWIARLLGLEAGR